MSAFFVVVEEEEGFETVGVVVAERLEIVAVLEEDMLSKAG